jgi:hypothetical protein
MPNLSAEMYPRSIAKHVIRQHLIEVVKSRSASHAVHGVIDRLVVLVLESAFVERRAGRGPLGLRLSTRDCDPEDRVTLAAVETWDPRTLPLILGMLTHSYVLSMLLYANYSGVWLAFIQSRATSEIRFTASLIKPIFFILRVFGVSVSRYSEDIIQIKIFCSSKTWYYLHSSEPEFWTPSNFIPTWFEVTE